MNLNFPVGDAFRLITSIHKHWGGFRDLDRYPFGCKGG